MFLTIFKKEFLDHMLGFRFAVSAVLCLLLVTISVIVLVGDYAARRDDYHRNMSAYRMEAEQEDNYMDLARHGVKVERPPANCKCLHTVWRRIPTEPPGFRHPVYPRCFTSCT